MVVRSDILLLGQPRLFPTTEKKGGVILLTLDTISFSILLPSSLYLFDLDSSPY
jgi:hypothetical protein